MKLAADVTCCAVPDCDETQPSCWFIDPEHLKQKVCNVCWADHVEVKPEEKAGLIRLRCNAPNVCANTVAR